MSREPVLTKETCPAGYGKGDDDPITNSKLLHVAARFLDDTHKLMPKNQVLLLREKAVINMQVGAADRGRGDSEDDILGMFDLWIAYVIK